MCTQSIEGDSLRWNVLERLPDIQTTSGLVDQRQDMVVGGWQRKPYTCSVGT